MACGMRRQPLGLREVTRPIIMPAARPSTRAMTVSLIVICTPEMNSGA